MVKRSVLFQKRIMGAKKKKYHGRKKCMRNYDIQHRLLISRVIKQQRAEIEGTSGKGRRPQDQSDEKLNVGTALPPSSTLTCFSTPFPVKSLLI